MVNVETINCSPYRSCSNNNKKSATSPHISSARHKPVTVSQELLNAIIAETGYSLADIEKETGIYKYTLNRIYHGKTKNPSLAIFKKILALYCRVCKR